MKELLADESEGAKNLFCSVKIKAHKTVLGLSWSRLTGAQHSDVDAGRQPGRPQVVYHL